MLLSMITATSGKARQRLFQGSIQGRLVAEEEARHLRTGGVLECGSEVVVVRRPAWASRRRRHVAWEGSHRKEMDGDLTVELHVSSKISTGSFRTSGSGDKDGW